MTGVIAVGVGGEIGTVELAELKVYVSESRTLELRAVKVLVRNRREQDPWIGCACRECAQMKMTKFPGCIVRLKR